MKRYTYIAIALSLALLCVIYLIPLNSDSDIYQSMAVDLVRYGKLPYMGSWDQNFPGIVYIHAISILLFGNADAAFRTIDLLANLLTAYLLYRFTKKETSSEYALIAPALYCVYYVAGGWWAIGQRDVFATTFILAALWLASLRPQRFWSGVFLGCAFLLRPTYLIIAPLLWLTLDRSTVKLARLSLGVLLPPAIFIVGYVISEGSLEQLYLATITYNFTGYAGIREPWVSLIDRSDLQWLILVPAVAMLLISPKRWTSWSPLLIGAASGLISLLVMRKFFIYHFHLFFTCLIPIVAILIGDSFSHWAFKGAKWIALGLTAIVIFSYYPRHLVKLFWQGQGNVSGKVMHVQEAYSIDSLFSRKIDRQLAKELGGEKNVELVSVTPAVHWMNELDQPSRFTMIHPLTITGKDGRYSNFQEQWRKEYVETLLQRRPRKIVLARGPSFLMKYIRKSPEDLALEIPGFAQLLQQSYVLDTTIGGYDIYTRNRP